MRHADARLDCLPDQVRAYAAEFVERLQAHLGTDLVGSVSHPALVCPARGCEFVLYRRAVVAEPTTGRDSSVRSPASWSLRSRMPGCVKLC